MTTIDFIQGKMFKSNEESNESQSQVWYANEKSKQLRGLYKFLSERFNHKESCDQLISKYVTEELGVMGASIEFSAIEIQKDFGRFFRYVNSLTNKKKEPIDVKVYKRRKPRVNHDNKKHI